MAYSIWIPVTLAYNFLACWIGVKYNAKDFVKTWLGCFAAGFIPTWALAAYFSRNLLVDSLIYDSSLVLSSIPILYFLGQGHGLSALNWVGVALVLLGLILAKL